MTLEQIFARAVNETSNLRWVLTAKGDTIDVFVPDDEDLIKVANHLSVFAETLIGTSEYESRAVKLLIRNDHGERLPAVVDSGLKSRWISLENCIINAIPMGYLSSD